MRLDELTEFRTMRRALTAYYRKPRRAESGSIQSGGGHRNEKAQLKTVGTTEPRLKPVVPRLGCDWCGKYHEVLQCLNPKNASKTSALPFWSEGAWEILDTNSQAPRRLTKEQLGRQAIGWSRGYSSSRS